IRLEESVGFTATHGSSSLFSQLISPGSRNPEMSQEAKGLSPLAGGLGVPDAWCTTVVAYGPAEATAIGRRINRTATAAARGMTFPMAYLPLIDLEVSRSCARRFAVSRTQAWDSRSRRRRALAPPAGLPTGLDGEEPLQECARHAPPRTSPITSQGS